MSLQNNKLAFPEIEDLIDFLGKNPSYDNSMVRDIASKSNKWTLSPKQINVLIKAWENIKSTGGQSPYSINLKNFPDLQKLQDFYDKKQDYDFQDDMIRSILYQSKSKVLSDKQMNVLIKASQGIDSPKLSFTEREIKNFEFALSSLNRLSRAQVYTVSQVPERVFQIIEKMKQDRYTENDDNILKGIVSKYKRKIYTSLFEY